MEDEPPPKKVGKDSGGGGSGVVSVCWSRSAASSKREVPVDETNIFFSQYV